MTAADPLLMETHVPAKTMKGVIKLKQGSNVLDPNLTLVSLQLCAGHMARQ